jgi:hypothetical protein
MSLTSFLERKDVRERFRQEFDMPGMKTKRELLAPPLSNRYSLVGTAFDYLARFYVKRLNPDAITKAWIAEIVLHDLSWMPIWRHNSQSDTTVYGFSWMPQEDHTPHAGTGVSSAATIGVCASTSRYHHHSSGDAPSCCRHTSRSAMRRIDS